MKTWTNPQIVARFAWRVTAYRISIGILCCGLLPLMIGLAFIKTIPGQVILAFGIVILAIGFLIHQVVWNCPNCKSGLNARRNYPSAGVECEECGARLYSPTGYYGEPSAPRNPRTINRDPNRYWTDPEVQARFRWRVAAYRAGQGVIGIGVLLFGVGTFYGGLPFGLLGLASLLVASLCVPIASFIYWTCWRCPHCKDPLDRSTEFPSREVLCRSCGAVLFEPDGPCEPAPAPVPRAHGPDALVLAPRTRDADGMDALAKADYLLTYDRKVSAVNVLLDALERDPMNAALMKKLTELSGELEDAVPPDKL